MWLCKLARYKLRLELSCLQQNSLVVELNIS